MKKNLRRYLRKIKYIFYYGIKPVVKTVTALGVTFKIILHPIKNGGIDIVIFNTGEWEPNVVKTFAEYLKPGAVVVDIGANIGYHSLFIASFLKDDCTVHSFEPQKNVYEQFKRSIEINNFSSIQTYNLGLANEESNREISLRDENIGSSSLLQLTKENPLVVSGKETISVKKLDTVLAGVDKVDFIKLDVEGFEYEVLLGAKNTLLKHKPIILFEYSPFLYQSIDINLPIEILKYLKNLGYHFYDVNRDETFSVTDNLFLHEQRDLLCRIND